MDWSLWVTMLPPRFRVRRRRQRDDRTGCLGPRGQAADQDLFHHGHRLFSSNFEGRQYGCYVFHYAVAGHARGPGLNLSHIDSIWTGHTSPVLDWVSLEERHKCAGDLGRMRDRKGMAGAGAGESPVVTKHHSGELIERRCAAAYTSGFQ